MSLKKYIFNKKPPLFYIQNIDKIPGESLSYFYTLFTYKVSLYFDLFLKVSLFTFTMKTEKYKHLSFEDRCVIEEFLNEKLIFKEQVRKNIYSSHLFDTLKEKSGKFNKTPIFISFIFYYLTPV